MRAEGPRLPSGTAGAFFLQVRALARKGYRVLSVQYPAYGSPEETTAATTTTIEDRGART